MTISQLRRINRKYKCYIFICIQKKIDLNVEEKMDCIISIAIFLIIFIVISFIFNLITGMIINRNIKRLIDLTGPLGSKLNDIEFRNVDVLRRIDRRCDAIDQRTKAHLNKKKSHNKYKNVKNKPKPAQNIFLNSSFSPYSGD